MSTLSEIIFEATHSFKSFTAIKVGRREISYDELNSKSLAVASILTASGAKAETIGLVGQRKASSYIGILGVLYAGCHYTPLNPKYSAARLQAIIQDAGIRFLVGDVDDLLKLGSVLPEEIFPPVVIVPEGTVPAGRKWISIYSKQRKTFHLARSGWSANQSRAVRRMVSGCVTDQEHRHLLRPTQKRMPAQNSQLN